MARPGYAFFVFHAAGNGETGPNGLKEGQGRGQPQAPAWLRRLCATPAGAKILRGCYRYDEPFLAML
jgi:hypothetical protein